MAIRYVAYTREGQRVAGTLTVDSEAAAEEMLWRSDLVVVSLQRTRQKGGAVTPTLARLLPTLYRPKAKDVVGFTRDLATLLESGIALHTSLRILQDRVGNPLLRETVQQVTKAIEAGGSLSQALAQRPSVFPSMYPRLVTVGEETGRLDIALRQVATHLEKQAATTQKLKRALGYPVFVGLLGMGSAFFMLTFSLPALMGLFEEFGAELPLTTRILMWAGRTMGQYGLRLFLLLAVTGLALAAYFRSRQGAARWDSLMLRLPVLGRVVWMANMFRFISTVHTLLVAGLPLTEALDMTARATSNAIMKQALFRLREDVVAGQSLSQALAKQPVFPNLVHQMVSVGEESGTLSHNLETLSNFYEKEADQGISSLTGMIEPAMILLVGGFVGFVALSVMSSLYGIVGQVR